MKKVLVAMSGGVDSSVAAYLLKEQGYECIGVTMKLYENETVGFKRTNTCCSLDDIEDARSVACKIDIPYHVFNFTDDFENKVIKRFVTAYENGFTPNPCIDCNRFLKFERLFERAKELDCDFIATGHYAQIEYDDYSGKYVLKKAVDNTKDQSYVLYSMTQYQLLHTIFPLGKLTKAEVRKIAEKQGFINADKHDSQDICFVPDGDYVSFLKRYTGKNYECGNFVDSNKNIIGRHKGIVNYTIGQRKGLGISSDMPLYVCGKTVCENTVTLGKNEDLFSKNLLAQDINLILPDRFIKPIRVTAKVRYRQNEQPAVAEITGDYKLKLNFDKAQRAITPGQAVVLYDGETVLGGGTIV